MIDSFIPRKFEGESESFDSFICKYNVSIILGETGSGKTYQLKYYYKRHKETSKYVELVTLDNDDIIDETTEIVLLDSIDEAVFIYSDKVVQKKLINYILKCRKINNAVKFVISCRYSEWKKEYKYKIRNIDTEYNKIKRNLNKIEPSWPYISTPLHSTNPEHKDKSIKIYKFKSFKEEQINEIIEKKEIKKGDFCGFLIKNNLLYKDVFFIKNMQVILYLIDNFKDYEKNELKYYEIYNDIIKCHLLATTDNARKKQLDKMILKEMLDMVSMLSFYLVKKGNGLEINIKKLSNDMSIFFDKKITAEKLKIICDTAFFHGQLDFFDQHNNPYGKSDILIYLSAYYLNEFDVEKIKKLTTHKLGVTQGFRDTLGHLMKMKPELVDKFIVIDPFVFNQSHCLEKIQQEKLLKSILNKLQNGAKHEFKINDNNLIKFDKIEGIEKILKDDVDFKKIDHVLYHYLLRISPLCFIVELWDDIIKKKQDSIKIIKYFPLNDDDYNIKFFDCIKKNGLLGHEIYNNLPICRDGDKGTFDFNLFNSLYSNKKNFNDLVPLLENITYKEIKDISSTLTRNELNTWFIHITETYDRVKYDEQYLCYIICGLLEKYDSKDILKKIIIFLQSKKIERIFFYKKNNFTLLDEITIDIWDVCFSNSIDSLLNTDGFFMLFEFDQDEIEKLSDKYSIEKNVEKYKSLSDIIHYLDWNFLLDDIAFIDEKMRGKNKPSEGKWSIEGSKKTKKEIEYEEMFINKIKKYFKKNEIEFLSIKTEDEIKYLKFLFEIDVDKAITFFMNFYNEKGKDKNLYRSLIKSFSTNDLYTGKNVIFLDKVKQEYIKELIVDFYDKFDADKNLSLHVSLNLVNMDTGLWHYLNDKDILEELKNSPTNKISRNAKTKLIPIYDQEAQQEKKIISEIVSEGTNPLIITEGKTDWMHMEKALRRFKARGFYVDLDIDFLRYSHPENMNKSEVKLENIKLNKINMGDSKLDTLHGDYAKMNQPRKVIFIFDRDNDDINKKYADEKFNKTNDVYSFCIPAVQDKNREKIEKICIEWYYKENDLKTKDVNNENRRLFLGKEFLEDDAAKKINYITCKKKFMPLDIIDKDVFFKSGEEEYENCKDFKKYYKNIALSKNAFTKNIVDDEEGFNNFDIENFKKIFDIIEEIAND